MMKHDKRMVFCSALGHNALKDVVFLVRCLDVRFKNDSVCILVDRFSRQEGCEKRFGFAERRDGQVVIAIFYNWLIDRECQGGVMRETDSAFADSFLTLE